VDLFTHVLVAYLVSYGLVGFHPQYLAAGALAGGLPDGDVIFFPIARRFPILRHHGITHSLFGVTVLAGVGAIVAPHLAPGSVPVYFLVMEAGGLSHIAQDGFTHFSVPPLLPFSGREFHLDADRAINFVTLAVAVVSFYLLLGVERNHVAFAWYLLTLDVLAVFYATYYGLRLAGRLWVGRRLPGLGPYDHVVPTSNPFVWLVLSERVSNGRERTVWSRYLLGRGLVSGPFAVEASLVPTHHEGLPRNETEALEWSLPIARNASRMLESTYHFAEVRPEPGGGWMAVWYSLEFTMLGRSAAVRVRFPGTGGPVEVRPAFYRPSPRSA
jgi:membrane-bound metal-dependent hydrolase YbcI (DUF457 family)